jgi:lysine/ornithine N-monooxygenase
VLSATWIPARTHWFVKSRDEAGVEREHTARILVCGTGALSIPREPDTPGWQSFKGPLFHSAEWRSDVDCTGKDVVVIGNGCSATQIIPVLAPHTKSLTQIVRLAPGDGFACADALMQVRTRHWIVPQLKSPFDNAAWRWMERNIPGVVAFERGLLVGE